MSLEGITSQVVKEKKFKKQEHEKAD